MVCELYPKAVKKKQLKKAKETKFLYNSEVYTIFINITQNKDLMH